jgi:hypothetical protein
MAIPCVTTSVSSSCSATRIADLLKLSCDRLCDFTVDQGINCEKCRLHLDRGEVTYGLVPAAQRGDRAAFEEIVQDYEVLVIRVALNVTGSQDSAQQIYTRVFRPSFR